MVREDDWSERALLNVNHTLTIRALKWRNFSLTCSGSPTIMKFYEQVHPVKRSKLARFREDIISIDRVMVSYINRHDVKILWHHLRQKCRNCFETFQTFLSCCSDYLNFAIFYRVDRDFSECKIKTRYALLTLNWFQAKSIGFKPNRFKAKWIECGCIWISWPI